MKNPISFNYMNNDNIAAYDEYSILKRGIRSNKRNKRYASTGMKILLSFILILMSTGCAVDVENNGKNGLCSNDWYSLVEGKIPTGDGQGHGPDLGSLEWRSVIEFRLGIRNSPKVPSLDTEQWCIYIHEHYIEPNA